MTSLRKDYLTTLPIASLHVAKRLPRDQRPIPKEVFSTDVFKNEHDKLFRERKIDDLDTVARWEAHKKIIREAAQHARDQILKNDPHCPFSCALTLATVARTIWHNDLRLGHKLLASSDLAKEVMFIKDAQISLVDPPGFEARINAAKTSCMKGKIREIDTELEGSQGPPSPVTSKRKRKKT